MVSEATPPETLDTRRAVLVCAVLTLGFGVVVTGTGLSIGILPVRPAERVSYALGVSAALPVLVAIMAYVGVQLVRVLARKGIDPGFANNIRTDLAFLALFLVATYFHFNLKMWMPVLNPARFDDFYWQTDQWVRPLVDLCIQMSTTIRHHLGDDTRWYQGMFLLLFVIGFCYFAVTRHRFYGHFVFSVLVILTVGALSYLIAPAAGPFLYETGASARAAEAQGNMYAALGQVQDKGTAWIAEWGPEYFTGALAAMPSLHVAHAAVMTYWMLASRSILAGFFLIATTWITIDAIGLRWHYVIDLPFGFMLAGLAILLAHRLLDKGEEQE